MTFDRLLDDITDARVPWLSASLIKLQLRLYVLGWKGNTDFNASSDSTCGEGSSKKVKFLANKEGSSNNVPAMMPLRVCWKLLSGPGGPPMTAAPAGLAIIGPLLKIVILHFGSSDEGDGGDVVNTVGR